MQRKNNDCEKWIWKINKISYILVRMAFKLWMHRAWNKQEQSYISAISIWYKDTVIQRTNIETILQFNICWIIIFISWLRQQIRCKRYIAIAGGSCKFNTREAGPVSRIVESPHKNSIVKLYFIEKVPILKSNGQLTNRLAACHGKFSHFFYCVNLCGFR